MLALTSNGDKRARCGECAGCLGVDCGSCPNCADKPKFGGTGEPNREVFQPQELRPIAAPLWSPEPDLEKNGERISMDRTPVKTIVLPNWDSPNSWSALILRRQ